MKSEESEMAEANSDVSGDNFIPLQSENNVLPSAESRDSNEPFSLTQVFVMENLENLDPGEPSKDSNKDLTDTNNSSNDEQRVESHESPSTVGGYTFKCAFCEQTLTATDNPKLLQCLHNACSNCVNNKIYEQPDAAGDKATFLECPQCEVRSDLDRIIENQFLMESHNDDGSSSSSVPSKLADIKCSSCSDDATATSWCIDCAEFICDSCVQAHQRLKITKDHTIKPKEEGIVDNQSASGNCTTNLYCMVHPHEKLSLFCESCDKLTCRDCQLIEHREHKYKFTNEIASEARKFIGDMLKDVGYKRVLLNSAMKVIDDRQTLIADKRQALVNEITNLVVKLTSTVTVRGKQLISKLTEVCESKQKTLQEKKLALEQLSKMTDHCIDFTQHALDNGSDMALLFSKKQVTDHLREIKCKRADIPNPEIPVRIHLALDKVPDLIKVMSTIGQIVVDGRIYPSQAPSPSNPNPPNSSPSPGQHHQSSSVSPMQQQPQQQNPQLQQSSPNYQGPNRMLTQGGQFGQGQFGGGPNQPPQYPQTLVQSLQQQPQMTHQGPLGGPGSLSNGQSNHIGNMGPGYQSLAQKMTQNMRPPSITPPGMPLSLQQHLSNFPSLQRIQQRPQLVRQLLPRLSSNGLNQQQQQVSSSTHPQAMHDRSNLRGLLQPNNPVYVQTGPHQYQAVQPHIAQQLQTRLPNQNSQIRQQYNIRVAMPNLQNRLASPQQQVQPNAQQQQQQQQSQPHQGSFPPPGVGAGAKWHIPQQTNETSNQVNANRNMTLPMVNDNFKITLKSQTHSNQNNQNTPATVTSTIPKTPSPNHVMGRSDTERNLDKYAEDSVKDLMATIAKLDSNGVQVLAEGRQKGGSPHVDSSTGDHGTAPSTVKIKPDPMESHKDDPNEDWCAVCMDGGELVCCDKCPKVFHQYCHIPNLSVEENDTWQCLLCMNFADLPPDTQADKKDGELSPREKKIAERIVLELYCQFDPSLPFREVVGPEHEEYHSIIKNPIALDTIRNKLNWNSADRYRNLELLVRDVRLMFKNAYTYNPVDTQVYNDAKTLEKFFDEQLEKFLPEYAYETFDDEFQPPSKKYRRILND